MAEPSYNDYLKRMEQNRNKTNQSGGSSINYASIYKDMQTNPAKYYDAFGGNVTKFKQELSFVEYMADVSAHNLPGQFTQYSNLYADMRRNSKKYMDALGSRGYKNELDRVKELYGIEKTTASYVMSLMDKSGVPGWSSIVKSTPELLNFYDYDPTNPDDEYLRAVDYAPSSFLTAAQLDKKLKSGYSADYYTKFDAAMGEAADNLTAPKVFKNTLKDITPTPSFYLQQLYKYDTNDPDDVINKALGLMPKSFKYDNTPEDEARQATGQLPQAAETYIKNSMEFNIAYAGYTQQMQKYVDEKYEYDNTPEMTRLFSPAPAEPEAPEIVDYVKQYYMSKDATTEQSVLKIRDYTTKTGYTKESEEEFAAPFMYLPDGKLPLFAEDFTPSEEAVKRTEYMLDYVGQHWYWPFGMTANAREYAETMLEADRQTDVINKLKASGEYDKLAAFEADVEAMLSPRERYTPENYETVVSNVDWVSGLGLTGGREELRETMKRALEVAGTEKGTYYDPIANAPVTMSRMGAKDRGTLFGNNDDVLRNIRAQLDSAGWKGELDSDNPAINELLKQAEYRTIQLQRQRLNDYYASLKEAPAWVIAIGEGMLQGTSNISSSLKSINAGLYEIFTGDDTASQKVATEQQSEDILRRQTVAAANEGEGFAQTLYDVAQTATEMGIELGAGYLLGAAIPVNEATTVWGKTFSKLVLDPKLYPFAVASLGRNLAQAELEGRTTAEKWTAALPNAYIESVLEQSIGFFSKPNPARKLLEKGVSGLPLQTLKNAGRVILENTLGEAIEENVQDIVNLGVRQIMYKNYDPKVYGSDIDMTSMWQTTKTTVLVGMLLSLFSIPAGFSSYRSAKQVETHFNNAVEAYTAGDMKKFDTEMRAFNEQFGGAINTLKEDMASGAIERVDEFLTATNQYEPELRNMYDAVQEAAGLRSLKQQGESIPDWMITQADARANESIGRIRSLKFGTPQQFDTLYDQVMNSEELTRMATGKGFTAELIGQSKAPLTNAQVQVLRDIEQVSETNPYVNVQFSDTAGVEGLQSDVVKSREDMSIAEAEYKSLLKQVETRIREAYAKGAEEGKAAYNAIIESGVKDELAALKKAYEKKQRKYNDRTAILNAFNAQGGFRKMFEQAANLGQGVQAPVSPVEGDIAADVQTPYETATTQTSPVAQGKYEGVARSIPFEGSVAEIVGQVPMSQMVSEMTDEEGNRVAEVLSSIKQTKASVGERIKSGITNFRQEWTDTGAPIYDFGKEIGDPLLYPLYNHAKQGVFAAQTMIGEEQRDLNGNVVGKSLLKIYEPIYAKGTEYRVLADTYVYHLHNVDRMTLVERGLEEENKPVFGESVTAEVSRQTIAKIEAEHPELKQFAEELIAYHRNLLKIELDSHKISQEDFDYLTTKYSHYVPTDRFVPNTSGMYVLGRTVSTADTIRTAKGSNLDLLPLDESSARKTIKVLQAVNKNMLGIRLFNDAMENPQAAKKHIKELSVEKAEYDMDSEKEGINDLPNTLRIYKDGEVVTMKVSNEMFFAFKEMTDTFKDYSAISKMGEKVNRTLKELVTGYNPVFSARNGIRDLQAAGLNSKYPLLFVKNYALAVKEIASNGEYWRMYKAMGGIGSTFFDYNNGLIKEQSKAKKYTLGTIETVNMAVEQMPRLAEFISTLEAGGMSYENKIQALYNAAEVTGNFGRSGRTARRLNKTFVPFLNPSIQGASRFVRRFTETKGAKEWVSLIGRVAALGILPSVINRLLYSGDDEWEKINDRDKDRYYLFKLGDRNWLKIPKGREVSIFGALSNRALGLQDADYGGIISLAGEQVAPINPLESNIFSPIMLTMFNTTWYGTPIESKRLQKYAPGQRFDSDTTSFAKWLGSITNWSPKKIDYLIDAYTGVIGDIMMPLMTPAAERGGVLAPAVNAFVLDVATTNKLATEFYDKVEDIGYRMNSGDPKTTAKAKAENKVIQKYADQVSELYKLIREAENSDKPDDEKLKIVRDLSVTISALQQEALKRLKR